MIDTRDRTDKTERTKRQLISDARAAAMDGRWTDAIAINEDLVERFPRDAEPHNRRGRALLEMSRYTEALDAYEQALKIDPANLIARRNLGRLDLLMQQPADTRHHRNVEESLPLHDPPSSSRRSARPGTGSSSTRLNWSGWPKSTRASSCRWSSRDHGSMSRTAPASGWARSRSGSPSGSPR